LGVASDTTELRKGILIEAQQCPFLAQAIAYANVKVFFRCTISQAFTLCKHNCLVITAANNHGCPRMDAMPAPLTPEQARAALDRKGISLAEFSRQHELNSDLVSDLLNGRKKGRRGQAHRAVVLLGIKEGSVS
jgi:gp16 family phage-associated protein